MGEEDCGQEHILWNMPISPKIVTLSNFFNELSNLYN